MVSRKNGMIIMRSGTKLYVDQSTAVSASFTSAFIYCDFSHQLFSNILVNAKTVYRGRVKVYVIIFCTIIYYKLLFQPHCIVLFINQ